MKWSWHAGLVFPIPSSYWSIFESKFWLVGSLGCTPLIGANHKMPVPKGSTKMPNIQWSIILKSKWQFFPSLKYYDLAIGTKMFLKTSGFRNTSLYRLWNLARRVWRCLHLFGGRRRVCTCISVWRGERWHIGDTGQACEGDRVVRKSFALERHHHTLNVFKL